MTIENEEVIIEEEGEQVAQEETVETTDGESTDDEVVVTIGDEKPDDADDETETEQAPSWVKDLRKKNREDQRKIRELEEKLAKVNAPPVEQKTVIGKKPSMSDDDIDYDADKFESALLDWNEKKRKAEQEEKAEQTKQQDQQKAWQARLDGYESAKKELKVKDFGEAEEVVKSSFDMTQQGIIVQGADNAALVVLALGKNSKKAAELAAIKDPIKFAFAIAKLETQLKVTNKKAPPPPAQKVGSSGTPSTALDNTLEKLRAEAEKTGDYSKVMAYKRTKKA